MNARSYTSATWALSFSLSPHSYPAQQNYAQEDGLAGPGGPLR
jgi:hypothetical protein